ncbi:MAG: cation:proton antiporter [Chloroflexi bacterium]|nr:cation:proton antiporter [Chloroflexota bacterium]
MENELAHAVSRLAFQLAVILLAAKIGGEISERVLKQPGVLGELVAGILIGPYALGALPLPYLGALFPAPRGDQMIPISTELYALAQIAAVILLFVAGLETDFQQFFRYGGPAAVVGVGGVVAPFALGVMVTLLFGVASSPLDPVALFVGAVLTATSVGITARVLSDIHRLDTPEGVTILAAAVIDDVLGILVLTIVVSMGVEGNVSLGNLLLVGGKALGFWLALMGLGVVLGPHIARAFSLFQIQGGSLGLAVALAFFSAALAESFGLAMIIGAYSIGLALSNTSLAETLEEPLRAVYHAFVPIFFVVMGMLVNVAAMADVLVFGLVVSLLAIIGKVGGCGLSALSVGFNRRGAWRIGIGMLPRGEVALIVAGVGLTAGVIESDVFGVAIMMTVITTLLAPVLLVPAFRRGGSGRRKVEVPVGGRAS